MDVEWATADFKVAAETWTVAGEVVVATEMQIVEVVTLEIVESQTTLQMPPWPEPESLSETYPPPTADSPRSCLRTLSGSTVES